MQQGIAIEKAREIVKLVKDSKKKAQASIQGDLVRVSSKDRDTLQDVIAMLKQHDFGPERRKQTVNAQGRKGSAETHEPESRVRIPKRGSRGEPEADCPTSREC